MSKRDSEVPATVAGNSDSKFPVAKIEALNAFAFMNSEAMEVVAENMGGQSILPSDFEKVKFPTGGGSVWEIPTIDGDTEMVKEVSGIVMAYKINRAFWADEYSGVGGPPDCQSKDLLVGVGTPGGQCSTCPNAQWGSDKKGGEGQACKMAGQLFLIKPGETLPIIVPVPVASVQAVKHFLLRLSSAGIKYYHAILSLGLEQTQNRKNIKYSRIKPKLMAVLPNEAKAQIELYIRQFRNAMELVTIDRSDVQGADTVH